MITLVRTSQSEDGTFGVLSQDGVQIAVTCEPPWLNNQHDISCIPAGTYECQKYSSVDHQNVWEVMDVPSRANILIHEGNTIQDTEGCILVGECMGDWDGTPSVLNSLKTLTLLRTILPPLFQLNISTNIVESDSTPAP
jgi:uncharacterized protein DUF5675